MENVELGEKRRITPEKVLEMLRAKDVGVTPEQAKNILELLFEIAEIVVGTYLDKQKKIDLPKVKMKIEKFKL